MCSLCCSLISADNGGPVARGKVPFLCSFLHIEISKFRKDLLLFFCHKLNLISGENPPLKETLSLQNHLFYSIQETAIVNIPSSEKYCSVKLIGKRSFEYFEVFPYLQKNGP